MNLERLKMLEEAERDRTLDMGAFQRNEGEYSECGCHCFYAAKLTDRLSFNFNFETLRLYLQYPDSYPLIGWLANPWSCIDGLEDCTEEEGRLRLRLLIEWYETHDVDPTPAEMTEILRSRM